MNFAHLRSNGVPRAFLGVNRSVSLDQNAPARTSPSSDVRAEFDKIAQKTPAERMRDALLKRLGHTEDSLKALPPEERNAIEAQLKQLIQEEMRTAAENRDRSGRIADIRI